MKPAEIIKYLWIKYDGDFFSILNAIKNKEEVPDNEEEKRKLAKFDSQYDSLTIIDDEYQKKIRPRLENELDHPCILIRWHRGVSKSIFDDYEDGVFLLGGELSKYNIPVGIKVFGYEYDSSTKEYSIYHHLRVPAILITKDPEEVKNFALATCRFLLVGNKDSEIDPSFGSQVIQSYLAGGDRMIMAAPGRPGCYANKCLKEIPDVEFIDCWEDIKQIIQDNNKEEK